MIKSLPLEIMIKIYEFDPTFKCIFRNVLDDINKHSKIVNNYQNKLHESRQDIYYHNILISEIYRWLKKYSNNFKKWLNDNYPIAGRDIGTGIHTIDKYQGYFIRQNIN